MGLRRTTLIQGPPGPPGIPGACFVYKPGATGTLPVNVFSDWSELMTAVGAVDGIKTIAVDASLVGGDAPVPVGAWSLQSCQLVALDASQLPQLTFVSGATLVNTHYWRIGAGLVVTNAGNAVYTPANGDVLYIDQGQLATLSSGGGVQPFVTVGASVTWSVLMFETGLLGDDINPVVNLISASAALDVVGVGSSADDQLGQHSCTGVAGSTVTYSHDDTSVARNNTVAGQVFVENLLSMAQVVEYVAGTPGNWTGSPPTTVASALDRLAAACTALGHKP